jgi:cytochrome c biogenesis protein CcmG/thiol:disulfide interchange protein DsbE
VSGRHGTRWIALTAAVLLVAFGVVLAVQHRSEASVPRLVQAHKPAPAFDLATLDGKQVSSHSLAGKTYVVNFWNSWCIPCQEEHSALADFYGRHAGDPGFAMVGIVRDDTGGAIRRYVAAEGVPYPVALDPGARASLEFGTRGQPETYAISPDGVITGTRFGPSSVANLEQLLAAARGQR